MRWVTVTFLLFRLGFDDTQSMTNHIHNGICSDKRFLLFIFSNLKIFFIKNYLFSTETLVQLLYNERATYHMTSRAQILEYISISAPKLVKNAIGFILARWQQSFYAIDSNGMVDKFGRRSIHSREVSCLAPHQNCRSPRMLDRRL